MGAKTMNISVVGHCPTMRAWKACPGPILYDTLAMAAPAYPPMRACEELVGSPSHHVMRSHAIAPMRPEPLQRIGHELLEACVLYAGNTLRSRKIGRGLVASRLALASIVHQELRDLAERPPFLTVVDDESRAACLGLAYALLDTVREIGAAGANIRAENVRAIAFVVHATGQAARRIADRRGITEDVKRGAANRR